MTVSIDAEGQVVVTTIVKIVIVYKVTRYVLVDPLTSYFHTFQSLSCRFASSQNEERGLFDQAPLIAIGSKNSVMIAEINL
jgi:hypothetical protein